MKIKKLIALSLLMPLFNNCSNASSNTEISTDTVFETSSNTETSTDTVFETSSNTETMSESSISNSSQVEILTYKLQLSEVNSIKLYRFNDIISLTKYKEEILNIFDNLQLSNEFDYSEDFVFENTYSLKFDDITIYVNDDNKVLYVNGDINYFSMIDTTINFDSYFPTLDLSMYITEQVYTSILLEETSLIIGRHEVLDSIIRPINNIEEVAKVIESFNNVEYVKLDMEKMSSDVLAEIEKYYNSLLKCYVISTYQNQLTIYVGLDFSTIIKIDDDIYYGKITKQDYAYIASLYY